MKSKVFILLAVLAMTGTFAACSGEEDSPKVEQELVKKNATIRATINGDFQSRVALEEENSVVKVNWKQGDDFKIKVNGVDYVFTYVENDKFECSKAGFPATFASAGTVTATYPANPPAESTNQPGTLKGAEKLLTMTATTEVTAGQSTENLTLNFKHENSIVKLTLSDEAFKGVPVTWITLQSGSTTVAAATESFAGTAAEGKVEVYFAVKPQEMTDVSIHSVCMKKDYTAALEDNTLTAGNFYHISKEMTYAIPMGDVSAADAVMGDYAMADGTFISGSTALTDEEKANVAGIVFWTAKQPTEAKLTPAKLTDDAVMVKDFPNCNHGLIVSLKHVSDGTKWQEKNANVSDWQKSDSFKADDKGSYKSIASTYDTGNPQGELINYILGYQNTKLLKAYNASLPAGSPHTVLPVSLLEIFSIDNPAPAKTTGWFIPSVKELALLRGKDVDNVGRDKSGGIATMVAIKEKLTGLGTDWADMMDDVFLSYWASTEEDAVYYPSSQAVEVDVCAEAGRYSVFLVIKDKNDCHVRAVCAY